MFPRIMCRAVQNCPRHIHAAEFAGGRLTNFYSATNATDSVHLCVGCFCDSIFEHHACFGVGPT